MRRKRVSASYDANPHPALGFAFWHFWHFLEKALYIPARLPRHHASAVYNKPKHTTTSPIPLSSLTSNSIATRSRAESETEAPEHYDDHTISSGGHMDGEYVAAPDAL